MMPTRHFTIHDTKPFGTCTVPVPYRTGTLPYGTSPIRVFMHGTAHYGIVPYGNVPYDTVLRYVFLRMDFVRLGFRVY